MKIAKGIRDTYIRARSDYQRLSDEVCAKLRPLVEDRGWFFTHRIKELESFALKIETGRVEKPERLEDFFACTIVVRTVSQIADVEHLLEHHYSMNARRPGNDSATHKRASDFVFDDLRLYLVRGMSASGRNDDLADLIFEVQIKTILQHAWGIASHDLIYKTDQVSWPKERIAYQVKAMLEHAEIAIAEAEKLAGSPAISKTDGETQSTLQIIRMLRIFFGADRLPRDIRRLAESIGGILRMCDIGPDGLEDILRGERDRLGMIPVDLSPYAFFVQALANNSQVSLEAKLNSRRNRKTKIVIHSEMDLPAWMLNDHDKIIRI